MNLATCYALCGRRQAAIEIVDRFASGAPVFHPKLNGPPSGFVGMIGPPALPSLTIPGKWPGESIFPTTRNEGAKGTEADETTAYTGQPGSGGRRGGEAKGEGGFSGEGWVERCHR